MLTRIGSEVGMTSSTGDRGGPNVSTDGRRGQEPGSEEGAPGALGGRLEDANVAPAGLNLGA